MKTRHLLLTTLLTATGLLGPLTYSHAAPLTFHVDIKTSSLAANAASGSSNAPFFLDFQLNNGTTAGNNTASLSNFTFLGGAPTGSPTLSGGASGNLNSSVALTDGAATEFYQSFTSTTTDIQFNVTLSLNNDATPDRFLSAILDNQTFQITTNDPNDFVSLVDAPISSALGLSGVKAYQSTDSAYNTPSPVTATVTAVPEPNTVVLALLGGLGGLILHRGRRASARLG